MRRPPTTPICVVVALTAACGQTAPPRETPSPRLETSPSAPATPTHDAGDPAPVPTPPSDAAGDTPTPPPPTATPDVKPVACKVDADCRAFSSYCGGCACLALGARDPDPGCPSNHVACYVNPCGSATAVCSAGRCATKRR